MSIYGCLKIQLLFFSSVFVLRLQLNHTTKAMSFNVVPLDLPYHTIRRTYYSVCLCHLFLQS